MGSPVSSAELAAIGAALRTMAGRFDARVQFYGDDVTAADRCVAAVDGDWNGRRSRNDLARVRIYVDQIRGMAAAVADVAGRLRDFAGRAEELAGFLATHESTLAAARESTPDGEPLAQEAWSAQRSIEGLHGDWLRAGVTYAGRIEQACVPLERAYAATAHGFSAPVVTGDAHFAALVALAALAGIDLADLGYDDDEVRARFESGFADVPADELVIAVLTSLTGAEAVAYWNTLNQDERNAIVTDRQDLAAKVLDGGGTLTDDDLRLLDRSNSFPQFSETFAAAFELSAGLRVVTIEVGGGYTVVAMKMSDGTVQVSVVKTAHLGAGADASGDGGEAEATVGAFVSGTSVFVFPDEASAEEAISRLQDEVVDYGFTDFVADAASTFWWWHNRTPPPDWLIPENELDELIGELWGDYGMERASAGGLYGNVQVEVENALAEADAEADVRIAVYDTDTTELATAPARTGIIVSGSLTARAEAGTGLGPSGSVAGSFTVDAHTDDEGAQFITVTVQGAATTGTVVEAIDYANAAGTAEWDTQFEQGVVTTVSIKVPVTSDTANAVRDVVTSLVTGQFPAELAGLHDAAEITITVDATQDADSEVEIDAGTAELDVEHTATSTTNLLTLHKYPGGELYSQNDLDEVIDGQLDAGADGSAAPPAATTEQPPVRQFHPLHPVPYSADTEFLYDADGEAVAIESDLGFVLLDPPAPPAPPALPVTGGPDAVDETAPAEPDAPPDSRDDTWGTSLDELIVTDEERLAPYGPEAQLLYDADGSIVAIDTGSELVMIDEAGDS